MKLMSVHGLRRNQEQQKAAKENNNPMSEVSDITTRRQNKMSIQKGQILISRGSWALRWWESSTDATGKKTRKRVFKTLGPVLSQHRQNTKRIPEDIQALADGFLKPLNTGTVTSVRGTIGQLVDDYLKFRQWKISTLESYENLWKRYLKNRISNKPLTGFMTVDAYKLFHEIHRNNKHLSRQTMAHIRFFLSGVFKHAINNGLYIGTNPAMADLPEGLKGKGNTRAYTAQEILFLLPLLTSPLAQAVIALGFGSGMRKGELAGVKWEDYEHNDKGAVIHVRRSIWRGQVFTPKTEHSADDVHIGPEIVAYIEAYRKFCSGVSKGFMFGYDSEHPINLDSFARWQLKPLMKTAGMEWKGWHGLRRGAATYLAKTIGTGGAEAAALVLRHTDTSTTEDHYIKNTKQERQALEAAKKDQVTRNRRTAGAVLGSSLRVN